jgi:hypothetical protein
MEKFSERYKTVDKDLKQFAIEGLYLLNDQFWCYCCGISLPITTCDLFKDHGMASPNCEFWKYLNQWNTI